MRRFQLILFSAFVQIAVFAQTETNKELYSDGSDWALKTVQEEGDKTVLLIGNSIMNAYKGSVAKELKNCRVLAWVNPYHLAAEFNPVIESRNQTIINQNFKLCAYKY